MRAKQVAPIARQGRLPDSTKREVLVEMAADCPAVDGLVAA